MYERKEARRLACFGLGGRVTLSCSYGSQSGFNGTAWCAQLVLLCFGCQEATARYTGGQCYAVSCVSPRDSAVIAVAVTLFSYRARDWDARLGRQREGEIGYSKLVKAKDGWLTPHVTGRASDVHVPTVGAS